MNKSTQTNPMIIDMIKGDVHVELALWPLLLVRIVAADDVGLYEINLFRIAEPFVAVSEICHQFAEEFLRKGKSGVVVETLMELKAITGTGRMFPIPELKSAGWTIPEYRRLEAA